MDAYLADFQELAYQIAAGGTWRGILLGALALSVLLPATLDLLDWRR